MALYFGTEGNAYLKTLCTKRSLKTWSIQGIQLCSQHADIKKNALQNFHLQRAFEYI